MPLLALPNEIHSIIASYLSINELLSLIRTCRTVHHVLIPDLFLRNSRTGNSTGFFACSEIGYVEGVDLMLRYGANIEAVDTRISRRTDGTLPNSQLTALDIAAGNGHHETVKLLLEKGARLTFRSGVLDRYSPLINATCMGFHQVTKLFLGHSAFMNHDGKSAIAHAAMCGLTGHCIHAGLHIQSSMNRSAVDYDATIGLLVEHGANVNAVGPFSTVSPLHNIALGCKPVQLRVLTKWGGDVTMKLDANNNTFFHTLAKRKGRENLFDDIMCLLEASVDLAAPNDNGLTPLHLAVQNFSFPGYELVWLLLKLGAVVDCKDIEGNTPFDLLLREAWFWNTPVPVDLKRSLLDYGAFAKLKRKARPICQIYTDEILTDLSLLFRERE